MSGTYSISSTNLLEDSLDGASQIPSTTQCNLNQLNQYQHKYIQTTSSATFSSNVVLDRESGRAITIQYPSFDLRLTNSSLLSPDKVALLVKCLLIIQALPEAALEEASEELEDIYHFHSNRLPQTSTTMIPASTIRSRLNTMQVRPPIVLET